MWSLSWDQLTPVLITVGLCILYDVAKQLRRVADHLEGKNKAEGTK